jgi:hypothetical protein
MAGVVLFAFCWLGLASVRFAPIYQGFEIQLPSMTRVALFCGPIGFPLFGLVAAAGLILLDRFSQFRWIEWLLIAVLAIVAFCGFRALFVSGSFMGPASRANQTVQATATAPVSSTSIREHSTVVAVASATASGCA